MSCVVSNETFGHPTTCLKKINWDILNQLTILAVDENISHWVSMAILKSFLEISFLVWYLCKTSASFWFRECLYYEQNFRKCCEDFVIGCKPFGPLKDKLSCGFLTANWLFKIKLFWHSFKWTSHIHFVCMDRYAKLVFFKPS